MKLLSSLSLAAGLAVSFVVTPAAAQTVSVAPESHCLMLPLDPDSRAQASALYQVAYYLGNSVGGTLGAVIFHRAGWEGVVAFGLVALLTTAGITLYATGRARVVRRRGLVVIKARMDNEQ